MSRSTGSDSLQDGVAALLENEKYFDIFFECNGMRLGMHKAFVRTRSRVLQAMIDGDSEEAKSGIISVEGFDLATVERMRNFFYRDTYDETPNEHDGEGDLEIAEADRKLLNNVKVAVAGEYYQSDQLKQLGKDKALAALDLQVASGTVLGFVEILSQVYATSATDDRKLKDALCNQVVRDWDALSINEYFQGLLQAGGDCALDMMRCMKKSHQHDLEASASRYTAIETRVQAVTADLNQQKTVAQSWQSKYEQEAKKRSTDAATAAQGRKTDATSAAKMLKTAMDERDEQVRDVVAQSNAEKQKAKTDAATAGQVLKKVSDEKDAQIRDLVTQLDAEKRKALKRPLGELRSVYETAWDDRGGFLKLISLYSGCCGQRKNDALAYRAEGRWILECSACHVRRCVDTHRGRALYTLRF